MIVNFLNIHLLNFFIYYKPHFIPFSTYFTSYNNIYYESNKMVFIHDDYYDDEDYEKLFRQRKLFLFSYWHEVTHNVVYKHFTWTFFFFHSTSCNVMWVKLMERHARNFSFLLLWLQQEKHNILCFPEWKINFKSVKICKISAQVRKTIFSQLLQKY